MCVGLSARVVRLQKDGTALVDASGARREVSAQLLEDLMPGDYVMVHALPCYTISFLHRLTHFTGRESLAF